MKIGGVFFELWSSHHQIFRYILMKIRAFGVFYIFIEISKSLVTDCAKTTRWIILIQKDFETKMKTHGVFFELWSLDH